MKKFLMTILILAMTVCGIIGIAACDKEKPDNSQNQGQVEQDKDKDKDSGTQKPDSGNQNPSSGSENKPGSGETTPGGEESKGDEGQTNPPKNPEEQQPGTQNPPETKPEDPKQDEDDKGGEEEQDPQNPQNPDPDLPQGDEPGDEEPEPKPDTPKPDTPKPDDSEKECAHNWVYTAAGDDRNNRQHSARCTKCGETQGPAKCSFGASTFVAATCTEDGYYKYVCSVCKIDFKSYGVNPKTGQHLYLKTGHQFDDNSWKHVDGTQYANSQHQRKCINDGCDYYEKESCKFDNDIKEPTCEEAGSGSHTCSLCGYSEKLLNGTTEALGHQWEYKINTDGKTHEKRCTRPGCSKSEFEKEDCTLSTVTEVATCTKGGSTTVTCEVCHRNDVTTTDPIGHKLDKNAEGYQATFRGHKGKCSVCGQEVGTSDALEAHQYGSTSFCLSCGFDGVYANSCYSANAGGLSLAQNGKGFLNTVSTVVLVESPYGEVFGPLKKICSGVFKNCWKLQNLYIPATVETIEADAFKGCTGLKNIYFAGTQDAWNKLNVSGIDGVTVTCQKTFDETTNGPKDYVKKTKSMPAMLADKRSY